MSERAESPRDRLLRELEGELEALDARDLRRDTRASSGAGLVDFVSNDYLGLARDARVASAASRAAEERGAGAGAARLLGGGGDHDAVERALASWLGAESALFFPSGFQANLGVLAGLCDRRDAIVSDEWNHASIVDACRLSRARVEIYRHADLAALERSLERVRGARRIVVVTETVFGMDGDLAPLEAIHRLCEKHRATLLLDEAHAIGVVGEQGGGAWTQTGLRGEALLGRIVTGGKALGAAGGFFVGDAIVRDVLLHRARSFVFTTASPPPVSGALLRAIELVPRMEAERARVRDLARRVAAAFGLAEPAAAIVPLVLGDSAQALRVATYCRERGFDIRAVRPPTVPEGTSRLRVSLHASNSEAEVDRLIATLREALADAPLKSARSESGSVPHSLPRSSRAIVVAGTDTGVGKTVVSALLVCALRAKGGARYFKPVQTGDESDTARVAALAAIPSAQVVPPALSFALPASPHTAAKAEGTAIDENEVVAAIESQVESLRAEDRLVVELAGGILVPYRIGFDQGDLLRRLGYSVVLVARSGLGTLNHTGLSIEALERRGVRIAAIFVVGEPHRENVLTLKAQHPAIPLFEVPHFDRLDGAMLERWVGAQPNVAETLP